VCGCTGIGGSEGGQELKATALRFRLPKAGMERRVRWCQATRLSAVERQMPAGS
jgi:hypothetical protein